MQIECCGTKWLWVRVLLQSLKLIYLNKHYSFKNNIYCLDKICASSKKMFLQTGFKEDWVLKELRKRNIFHALFLCGHYFVQYGFIKDFWKTEFFCLSVFFVFCIFCLLYVRLDISFINFLTLHNHCLHSSRFQVPCVFALIYLKKFVKTDNAS